MFVNHQGKDSHLGGTSLVELNSTLAQLGLSIEGVPAEVKGAVAEVTNEFSSGDVLHDGKLEETNEGDNLSETGRWDGVDGSETSWDGLEGGAGEVNVAWETGSGLGHKVSDNGKHGDTSVLDLDVSETVELLLVTVGNQAKRIEESERSLGTELAFEGVEGSHLGGGLGWSESSSGGKEGCDDNRLHFYFRDEQIMGTW